MNNTVYAWETKSIIVDSAYTQFFINNQVIIETALIIVGILLLFSFATIWLLPAYTYHSFSITSLIFGIIFILIFTNKNAGLYILSLSYLSFLIGIYQHNKEELIKKKRCIL